MLLAAVFRHWQSPFPVSLFLGAFWWYLCSRTLHFVEARCCDVSPTSSSALCGQPAPNRRLVWFPASRTGPVTGQQPAPIPQQLHCTSVPGPVPVPYLYRPGSAPSTADVQEAVRPRLPALPLKDWVSPPPSSSSSPLRSADGFCLRLPRAVAQPALLHLFAVLQSESVRPAICDLLTVNRSPRAIRAGRPQTQQPPSRTIFSPATCRTSSA